LSLVTGHYLCNAPLRDDSKFHPAHTHSTQFPFARRQRLGLQPLSSATVASLVKTVAAATQSVAHLTPEQAAMDEDYWAIIQNAFTVTRGSST